MALDEMFRGLANFVIWKRGKWMKKSLF
jgi:Na+-driven multidrug efflux pump